MIRLGYTAFESHLNGLLKLSKSLKDNNYTLGVADTIILLDAIAVHAKGARSALINAKQHANLVLNSAVGRSR